MTPVKVELRRSGGVAGISLVATMDAGDLPADQAEVVAGLLSDDPAPSAPAPPPPGADRFAYELRLDDGQRARTIHWDEPEVPEAARPLLASLVRRARPTPLG